MLREKFIKNIRLTDTQKQVMAKIVAAPTAKIAAEDISEGRNLVAARDMLVNMGLISFQEDKSAELTDEGKVVAKEENIIDDTGSLTPDGEKLAFGDKEKTESFSLLRKLALYEGKKKDLAIKSQELADRILSSEVSNKLQH
ncbi:MAG: hypothetical protein QXL17_02655 [Candidatus Thermoplasmatota archaeon]